MHRSKSAHVRRSLEVAALGGFFIAAAVGNICHAQCYTPDTHLVGRRDSLQRPIWQAGLPDRYVHYVRAKKSEEQWTWSACVQMIAAIYDIPITQQQVIKKLEKRQTNTTRPESEIANALCGYAIKRDGTQAWIGLAAYPLVSGAEETISNLSCHRPFLARMKDRNGEGGHVYLLTSVTYVLDSKGAPVLCSALLRDPLPKSPAKIEISWSEFMSRTTLIASVSIE